MNLCEWADSQGVPPQTAYRRFRAGTMPVPVRKMGKLNLVGDLKDHPHHTTSVAVYAHVSSSDQRADPHRREARVTARATSRGHAVDRIVTALGSGLNGKRRKFLALLSDPSVTTIIVEHLDSFAWFGSEYIAASLAATGRQFLVADDAEVDNNLGHDTTEVLTSFFASRYGTRAAAHRTATAHAAAGESTDAG